MTFPNILTVIFLRLRRMDSTRVHGNISICTESKCPGKRPNVPGYVRLWSEVNLHGDFPCFLTQLSCRLTLGIPGYVILRRSSCWQRIKNPASCGAFFYIHPFLVIRGFPCINSHRSNHSPHSPRRSLKIVTSLLSLSFSNSATVRLNSRYVLQ
jgi:hypothetical protein